MNTERKPSRLTIILFIILLIGFGIYTVRTSQEVSKLNQIILEQDEKEISMRNQLEKSGEIFGEYNIEELIECETETKEVLRLKYLTEKARDQSTKVCGKVKDMPEFLKNPQKWYKVYESQSSQDGVVVERIQYNGTGTVVKEGSDVIDTGAVAEEVAEDDETYTIPE